jgi:hypothetical protein
MHRTYLYTYPENIGQPRPESSATLKGINRTGLGSSMIPLSPGSMVSVFKSRPAGKVVDSPSWPTYPTDS